MSKKAEQERKRQEARETLLAELKPGDTVYTILRHVSRSGMLRVISPVMITSISNRWGDKMMGVWDFGYTASRAMDWRIHRLGGIAVDGAGMDMGFHLVYSLSRTLWPEGHPCIGKDNGCPSNDHNNDRNGAYTHHKDGGYALRHSWL